MTPISVKKLRDAEWVLAYAHLAITRSSPSFKIFTSSTVPDVSISHTWFPGRNNKVRIEYNFKGRRTDSPTQVVRWYNEEARKASLR